MPFALQLSIVANQIVGLHYKLLPKKNMSIELCSCNYPTPNGLVNDANTTFEYYVRTSSKSLIWINFHNPQIGINIRI
jgi:hypothetical protein